MCDLCKLYQPTPNVPDESKIFNWDCIAHLFIRYFETRSYSRTNKTTQFFMNIFFINFTKVFIKSHSLKAFKLSKR